MKELPHSKSCFVCGSRNRFGLNLRFRTDGQIVETLFTPQPEHGGFVGIVHGGLVATVLDEVMVWACAVRQRRFTFSAEMTVRYLRPIQTGVEVIARGEMIENRKDRIYLAKGELLSVSGLPLANSTAKFMPVQNVDPAVLRADFEGTEEQLREFFGGVFGGVTPVPILKPEIPNVS